MAIKPIFKDMFENSVHVGHPTQKWNPRMKKYLYGEKNGIHIINLEETERLIDKALQFVEKMVMEGKNILFVSTKPQAIRLIEDTAKDVNMPYVSVRWIPGLLTNFSTLKVRIKYFTDLKEQEANGDFEKYTKKEASNLRKTIAKLEDSLGGVQNLRDVPNAVFVLDVVRDKVAVKEANRLGIPVVAITDSNADPSIVNYPIPANDDSIKSLKYVVSKFAEVMKGRKGAAK